MQQLWARGFGPHSPTDDPHPLTHAVADDPVMLAKWMETRVAMWFHENICKKKGLQIGSSTICKPLSDAMRFCCFSFDVNQSDIDAGKLVSNTPVSAEPPPIVKVFIMLYSPNSSN